MWSRHVSLLDLSFMSVSTRLGRVTQRANKKQREREKEKESAKRTLISIERCGAGGTMAIRCVLVCMCGGYKQRAHH